MVAALFVARNGPYAGLPYVELWDEARDARRYAGPWPVVAHPPCERWGRFYFGGPQWLKDGKPRKALGDDGGCFRSALSSVRLWGGVLEHPAGSSAWEAFGLKQPPRAGGWVSCGLFEQEGWTCCVDQGHYGHRGQKATWLYAVGVSLPDLRWGRAARPHQVALRADMTTQERRRVIRTGFVQRMSKRERAATPVPFRDLLLGMARSVPAVARDAESPRAVVALHSDALSDLFPPTGGRVHEPGT